MEKKIKNIEDLTDALFESCERVWNNKGDDSDDKLSKQAETTAKLLAVRVQRQKNVGVFSPIKGLDDAYAGKNGAIRSGNKIGSKQTPMMEEFIKSK